jgi:hypothetical protein
MAIVPSVDSDVRHCVYISIRFLQLLEYRPESIQTGQFFSYLESHHHGNETTSLFLGPD